MFERSSVAWAEGRGALQTTLQDPCGQPQSVNVKVEEPVKEFRRYLSRILTWGTLAHMCRLGTEDDAFQGKGANTKMLRAPTMALKRSMPVLKLHSWNQEVVDAPAILWEMAETNAGTAGAGI